MESAIELGYWNVRGRAEPIRLLLHYLNVPYKDRVFALENRSDWENHKANSSELFINLPYIEFQERPEQPKKIICESDSICLYFCSNYGGEKLIGPDPISLSKMRGITEDIKYFLSRYAYHTSNNPDEADQLFLQKRLLPLLNKLNQHFSHPEGPYLFGKQICYLDFILYESLKTLEKINKLYLEKLPNLVIHIEEIEKIPQIKSYLQSPSFYKNYLFYGDPSHL